MPQFLEKILSKWGYSRKGALQSSASGGSDPFIIWRSSKKVPVDRAFEVYAGWVYACIRAIAEEIAAMELQLFKVGADGDEEVFEHEILDLLDAVNPYQTGLELKYNIAAHLEAVGNAYVYLEGVKSEKDKPTALYVLNPAKVKVVVNRNVFPTAVEKFQYRTETKVYEFKPYEVLHIKYPDPSDPFEGIGTVQTIAQWIDADNYAMEFNRRFFLNGARLGGFLESENAHTPEQLDYLKKSFEAIFKGVENAYKVAALPKGTKFSAAAETQKDMDFSNLMDKMRDRILAGFRVPRTALGITDDVNRANAEATNYVFALRTIKPKMELITSYFNEFLVPRYGDDVYLSYADPVPENRELRLQEMQAAMAQQPVMSVNEAREEYFGLEPVENGDEVSRPFQFALSSGKPRPKATKRPSKKANGRIRTTRHAKNAKARKDIASELAKKLAKDLLEAQENIRKTKNISTLSDNEWEILWKGFVTRVTPYENLMKETIRNFNAKQKREADRNLSSAIKSTKGIDKEALFDKEEWVGALVDASEPILGELMAKEGKEAAALLGVSDIDIMTPEVKKALRRALELMSDSYNETTLNLLKERLEQGLGEGLSLAELKDRIAEVYEFSDERRAEQVARTETFRIANDATQEGWKQTGVVKSIKWYTAADERVCPYCDPLHGKVVGIDENFFEKGDAAGGSDGTTMPLDYEDVGNPPLHVSCRCYIRPEEISIE